MKIKKSQHEIKVVPIVENNHIPLAYMHGDKKVYDCNIIQEHPATGIRKITPYERFDSYNKIFFESNTKEPESLKDLSLVFAGDYLKRDKDGYYYEPITSIKFDPLKFFYHVTCQRTQSYSRQKNYNYKVSCVDKNNRLAQPLIEIFADAPDRGMAPHNVWINNKDTSVKSLADRSLYENDFVFIESTDGQNYAANNEKIEYEKYFETHTNLWLCCSDINLLENSVATLNKSILYNEAVTCSKYTFVKSNFNDKYLPAGGETVTFFNGDAIACIVKHYQGKGFIVISSDRFIETSAQNYKMIYEIMSQIYLMSYVKSKAYSGYVCDESVDYIVRRNHLINNYNFRSERPYYEYFNSYHAKDFKLIKVKLSSNDVVVSHAPDYIYFKKNGGPKDPKKPIGAYSIMLETQEVTFVNKWHYVADTQIDYTIERLTEHILVKLYPFCLNHVYISELLEIKIPIVQIVNYEKEYVNDATYVIVYKEAGLACIREEIWDNTGKLLFKAYVHLKSAPIDLIDMRIRGGGLPENKRDNYNLLDIGHSQGRPFRKSGAFVVKLPIESKLFHDEILKKLKQISPAERFYSIIYEQRGDKFEDDRL